MPAWAGGEQSHLTKAEKEGEGEGGGGVGTETWPHCA